MDPPEMQAGTFVEDRTRCGRIFGFIVKDESPDVIRASAPHRYGGVARRPFIQVLQMPVLPVSTSVRFLSMHSQDLLDSVCSTRRLRAILPARSQQPPGDASVLVCNCDRSEVRPLRSVQFRYPESVGGIAPQGMTNNHPSAMNE